MSIRDITPKLGYETARLLDLSRKEKAEYAFKLPEFNLHKASEFVSGGLRTGNEVLFNHIERFPFNKPFPVQPDAMIRVNLKLNAEVERFNDTPLSYAWHRRSLIFARIHEAIHRAEVRSEAQRRHMLAFFEEELQRHEFRVRSEFLKQKIRAEHQTAVHMESASKDRARSVEIREHSIQKSDSVRDRTLAALAMKMLISDIKYQVANETELKELKKKRWIDFAEAMRHVIKNHEAQVYIKERIAELIKPIYGPQELRVLIRVEQLKGLLDRISEWRKQLEVASFELKESHTKIQEGQQVSLARSDQMVRQSKEQVIQNKARMGEFASERLDSDHRKKIQLNQDKRDAANHSFQQGRQFVLKEKSAESIQAALQFSLISDWIRMSELEKTELVDEHVSERLLAMDDHESVEESRRDYQNDLKKADREKNSEHEDYLAAAGENKFDNLRFGPGKSPIQVQYQQVLIAEAAKRDAEALRDYKAAADLEVRKEDLRQEIRQDDLLKSADKFKNLRFGAEETKEELQLRKEDLLKSIEVKEERFEGLRLGAGLSEEEKKLRKIEYLENLQNTENLFEQLRLGSDQSLGIDKNLRDKAELSANVQAENKIQDRDVNKIQVRVEDVIASTKDARILEQRLQRLRPNAFENHHQPQDPGRELEPLSLSDHLKVIQQLKSDLPRSVETRQKEGIDSYSDTLKAFSAEEFESALTRKV